jgi:transcriptional regulator with XRE-family HTH domain
MMAPAVLRFGQVRAAELGEFLRSRRARVDPVAAGFPATHRRRSSGLRREELSSLAGVAVSWLAKLGQGGAHAVSPDVLDALAHTLKLDAAERSHLFALAGLRAERADPPAPRVTPALRALLTALEPNPAYLLDWAWNMSPGTTPKPACSPGCSTRKARPTSSNWSSSMFSWRGSWPITTTSACVSYPSCEPTAPSGPMTPSSPTSSNGSWRPRPALPTCGSRTTSPRFMTTRRVFDHPTRGRLELDHHRLAVLDQPGAQLVVYTATD